MISLREISGNNFNECISLERKSQKYVGNAADVLAEAYIYRYDSTAYGIYHFNEIIGLVILRDKPINKPYSFTDLFISDSYQNHGYGKAAVGQIIDIFSNIKLASYIEIQVHNSNDKAIKIYEKYGFNVTGKAEWDKNFLIMQLLLN